MDTRVYEMILDGKTVMAKGTVYSIRQDIYEWHETLDTL